MEFWYTDNFSTTLLFHIVREGCNDIDDDYNDDDMNSQFKV